jgi:hypothetical protein
MTAAENYQTFLESDVLRLIADRKALIAELVERAAREPSPQILEELKLMAKSGAELLERLTAERNALAEDLACLAKVRAAPVTYHF